KDSWQAWNAGWRSAVKMIEQTVSGSGNDKRPLDKQNVLVVGSGSFARSMVYGIGKRKGLVSITAPDDKEAQNLATQFDVRFVPFQHLYNTLADVVVFAEPGLTAGSSKTEFNPSYLEPRMTVCDATEAPFDSVFTAEARGRGAKVVEPKLVYADLLSAQIKSITGKDVPASEFTEIIDAAIDAQRVESDI
ncbi:MAG: 3-dehydroquinate dehydratase/shikimate dehydrogenase, partial [Planctomycetaceae bacterium]